MDDKLSVELLDGVLDTIKDFSQSDNAFCSYRFFSHELMSIMPTDPAKGSNALDAAKKLIGTPSEPVGTSSEDRATGTDPPDKQQPVIDANPLAGGSAENADKISEEIDSVKTAARERANNSLTSDNKTGFILASKSKGLKDCLNDDSNDNSTRKFVTGFLSLAAPPRASQELRQKIWLDLMHVILRSPKFVDLALCGQASKPDKPDGADIAKDLIVELDEFIKALGITPDRAFEEIVSLSFKTLVSTSSRQDVKVPRAAVPSSNLVMPMDTMIDNLISLSGRSYKCYAQTTPGQSKPGSDKKKPDIPQQLILAAAYGSILQRNIKKADKAELEEWMKKGVQEIAERISGMLSDRTSIVREASIEAAKETAVKEAKRKAKKETNEIRGKEALKGKYKNADKAIEEALSFNESTRDLLRGMDEKEEKRREMDTQRDERERVCSEFPKPFSAYFTLRLMCVLTGKKWEEMKGKRPFTTPQTCGARLLDMSKKEKLKYMFKDVKQEIDDRLTLMDYSNWIAETSDSAISSQYGVPPEPALNNNRVGEEKEDDGQ